MNILGSSLERKNKKININRELLLVLICYHFLYPKTNFISWSYFYTEKTIIITIMSWGKALLSSRNPELFCIVQNAKAVSQQTLIRRQCISFRITEHWMNPAITTTAPPQQLSPAIQFTSLFTISLLYIWKSFDFWYYKDGEGDVDKHEKSQI